MTTGDWVFTIKNAGLPNLYSTYRDEAEFVDEIDLKNPDGTYSFFGVSKCDNSGGWPRMIFDQSYLRDPSFTPDIRIVPETSRIFIGAGERLLCYDFEDYRRLWQDHTDAGLLGWNRFGSFVLMSAEMEFGVWSLLGEKLWSRFAEPPWTFEIKDEIVALKSMERPELFHLKDGTPADIRTITVNW